MGLFDKKKSTTASAKLDTASEIQKNKVRLQVIDSGDSWYSLYLKLPMIIAITIIALTLIWAIVDLSTFSYSLKVWNDYKREYVTINKYGIFHWDNGFLVFIVWMLIGSVASGASFFFTRIGMAPKLQELELLSFNARMTLECERYNEETVRNAVATIVRKLDEENNGDTTNE